MKRTIYLSIAILTLFLSCSKDEPNNIPIDPSEATLIGTWRFYSEGFICDGVYDEKVYPSDDCAKKIGYTFFDNGTYIKTGEFDCDASIATQEGTYELIGNDIHFIYTSSIFEDGEYVEILVFLEQDELTMGRDSSLPGCQTTYYGKRMLRE